MKPSVLSSSSKQENYNIRKNIWLGAKVGWLHESVHGAYRLDHQYSVLLSILFLLFTTYQCRFIRHLCSSEMIKITAYIQNCFRLKHLAFYASESYIFPYYQMQHYNSPSSGINHDKKQQLKVAWHITISWHKRRDSLHRGFCIGSITTTITIQLHGDA